MGCGQVGLGLERGKEDLEEEGSRGIKTHLFMTGLKRKLKAQWEEDAFCSHEGKDSEWRNLRQWKCSSKTFSGGFWSWEKDDPSFVAEYNDEKEVGEFPQMAGKHWGGRVSKDFDEAQVGIENTKLEERSKKNSMREGRRA